MSATDTRPGEGGTIESLARWLDSRLRLAEGGSKYLRKAFPAHWTFLFGEVALFCLVVLLFTGTFLALFYVPDTRLVTYDGPYGPLQGREISAAFDSVLRLSFEVRAGLLMRQIHHWAALVFVAAIVVHMLRVFFTGSFRRPRELNWVIGVALLLLAFGAGFTGYSLPDDLLSGTGLRIGYSALLSTPFVGPLAGFIGLGGEFPGTDVLGRLHIMHVMLIPAGLVGLVGMHLAILGRQKHTQKPSRKATNDNVVGEPLFPNQTMVSLSLFLFTIAVLSLIGGLFEINPVWLYGPYEPFEVFAPAQPDWYMGWLEGLLRLWPAWEFTILGVTIPSVFIPAVLVPGGIFTVVFAWPWIERRITGDDAEHHLSQRPRDVPVRTGVGVGGITLLLVIFVAGANDVIAADLGVGLQTTTNVLRVLVFVLPVLFGWMAYRMARWLTGTNGVETADQPPGPPSTEPDEADGAAEATHS
ncbi:MAG: cytochrome bc complex cytochrome b subunit [Nitriliruptorales bacterium]|nr:cytochrome bc complex cytochrome b subunit [Nitriliruptorales bacterium]